MKLKQYEAKFKALESEGGQTGEFEAVVAVFDNVDRAGDRLKSTAFDATLKAWRDSGDPIPVILSHKWDDPMAIIGHADPENVKAIPGRGLYVKGQLHVGRGNEVADQVYRLMGDRLLKEFSFGYTVPQGGEKRASDGAYDISAVNLIELGPCLKGVNPDTELLAVKALLGTKTERHDSLCINCKALIETEPEPVSETVTEPETEVSEPVETETVNEAGSEEPEIDLEPDKALDVLVYEAAIANLEAKYGPAFEGEALETARLDAELDALLGDE